MLVRQTIRKSHNDVSPLTPNRGGYIQKGTMKIEQIDKILDTVKVNKNKVTLSQKYGVMGLCLGKELHQRLRNYANKNDLRMSNIIKALLITYLNEKEKNYEKDRRKTV